MADRFYALNEARGCLALGGEDARVFLQGLLSNDVRRIGQDRAIYAALLTPQGRFLHDLFLVAMPAPDDRAEIIVIDGEAARLDDLRKRLATYRLRAKVTIADFRPGWVAANLWGADALAALELPAEPGRARGFGGGSVFVDPRLPALGARAILPREGASAAIEAAGFEAALLAAHRRLRLGLGIPEGGRDLPVERALLLENGFDELHGVDFAKGCYIGQELTARMKYRTLVKKRLYPVVIDGPAPEPGTPVTRGGQDAGELRSAEDGLGLALLRIDLVEAALASGGAFDAGAARLRPIKPAWFALPAAAADAGDDGQRGA